MTLSNIPSTPDPMLRSEFPDHLPITMGALVPSIEDQVKAHGLCLSNADAWERRHRAWNLLRIGGFLTDAETDRIARRLMKGISRDAYYDTALQDLLEEIAAGQERPYTPAVEPDESVENPEDVPEPDQLPRHGGDLLKRYMEEPTQG